MTTKLSRIQVALVLSIVLLVTAACATSPATPVLDTDTAAMQQPAPEETVQEFYTWYLNFIGDRSSGEFRNPLVERAYRDAPNLSAGFIEQVDTLLDEQTEELGGIPADPFLCAQDIPEHVDVAAISGADSGIDVEMQSSFENHTWTVHVEPVDGHWMITDIRCAPVGEPAAATPEMTVESFYAWYLDYIGERGSDEMRNPLVDGAYRDTPYLTEDFVDNVDALLAKQREQPGGGYDPFLCAQDIPTTIDVGSAQGTANTAEVPVTTDFAGHSFTVELIRVDGSWKIRNVVCAIGE